MGILCMDIKIDIKKERAMLNTIIDTINTIIGIITLMIAGTAILCSYIQLVRHFLSKRKHTMSRQETEQQCKHCFLYEERLRLSACYEPDCCDFDPTDDFI